MGHCVMLEWNGTKTSTDMCTCAGTVPFHWEITCVTVSWTLLEHWFAQSLLCGSWESGGSEEGELGSRLKAQATWQWCSRELSRGGGTHCHRTQCRVQVLAAHGFTNKFTHVAWVCVLPTLATIPRDVAKGHRRLLSDIVLFFNLLLLFIHAL